MVSSPKVSVFIASYNHALFLPDCLDSILAQTYKDFEIVVVDDGSTDGSLDILKDYQVRFPGKVNWYMHPDHENHGISATSNLAIERCRGEYLAWIGSDDAWYPEKLELQIAQLDENPAFGMVYCYADFIDREGRKIPGRYGVDITGDSNPVGQMIYSCHPPAMTAVFRRKCLEDVGSFNESLVYSDWELFVRIFARWKVGFIAKSLAMYRIHDKNVSKKINPKTDLNRIEKFLLVLEDDALKTGGSLLLPRNLATIQLQLSFLFYCAGDEAEAENRLRRAFRSDPTLNTDSVYLNEWLSQWKPEFYTLKHSYFGLWAVIHFPDSLLSSCRAQLLDLQFASTEAKTFFVQRGISFDAETVEPVDLNCIFFDCPNPDTLSDLWKNEILKEIYPALVFASSRNGNQKKVRHYWRKALVIDKSWLKNRGFWVIGLRAHFPFLSIPINEKRKS